MAVLLLSHADSGHSSEDHEVLRSSAQTRTWEQAKKEARKLEEAARRCTQNSIHVGRTLLTERTNPNLVKFRATWGNGPHTSHRKHEGLIRFVEFSASATIASTRIQPSR
jgi:beta-lactamase superfamily II metal-dependent hydrolase